MGGKGVSCGVGSTEWLVGIISKREGGVRTPGSEAVAWMKEDIQTKNKYAKMMGIEGETLSHNHGALDFS